jgi:hypothetical protein
MKLFKLAVVALGFLGVVSVAPPARAWVELGARDVADRTDHDVIKLPDDRRFTHIRLCVYRFAVRFYDVEVSFHNGSGQTVHVASLIRPGRCTRAIDLDGGQRNIERISLTYETTRFRRRTATVRVFGE